MEWFVVGVWLISYAYTRYMQSRMKIPAQTPAAMEQPTAAEGIAIPVVFGSAMVKNPNVTAMADKNIVGYDNVFHYSASVQMALCHGKIDKILDVLYADKSCLRRADTNYPYIDSHHKTTGSIVVASLGSPDPAEEGVFSNLVVNSGTVNNSSVDAGAADYLAKALGLPGDVGPKYYGVASVILRGCEFGASPYPRPLAFYVKRIHSRNGGDTQWYDEKAEITRGTRSRKDLWKYKVQGPSDHTDYSGASFDDSAWTQASGGIGNAPPEWYGAGDYSGTLPLPYVTTQLPTDSLVNGIGSHPNEGLNAFGVKLWLRWDLGALPVYPLNVQCWHADSATLWFNGTLVTLVPTASDTDAQIPRYNSTATIPKELINPTGPNVIAMRVVHSLDKPLDEGGVRISATNSKYIYAGLATGVDVEAAANAADMNPAHIVYEVLTDTIWGLGHPTSMIDDTAFRAAADTLYAEGLGLSFVWSQQMSAEDFLNDIMRHISGAIYIDRSTGLFVLKLLRADYTVGSLVVLDESNISRIEDASRKQMGEIVGSVTVTYSATMLGQQGSQTIQDEGVIAAQGGVVSSKIDYPAVTSPVNASRLAMRDLRVLSAPLLTCKVTAGRAAALLNIGDAFVLNWPDLEIVNFVMRVTEIDIGSLIDNSVKVTCVEDLFYFPAQAIAIPNDPITKPIVATPTQITDSNVYNTACVLDTRNKGNLAACFIGAHAIGSNTPLFEGGWTEDPPGVLTRNSLGVLPDAWFDGVPVDALVAPGSWLVGKSVLATYQGDTSITGYDEKHQGVYVMDNAGIEWVDVGLSTQHYVSSYARMHRDPSYSKGEDFVKDMLFYIENGTLYGGHYIQLATDNVALGLTPMAWTDLGTTFTKADKLLLLRNDQIQGQATSPDSTLTASKTCVGTADFDGFLTLDLSPGTTSIPAGMWTALPSVATLSGGDVGSITTLGFKVYRVPTVGGTTMLFEMLTAPLVAGVQQLGKATYSAPQYTLEVTDKLALVPCIHSDSTTPVTVTLAYNGSNAIRLMFPRSVIGIPTVDFLTVELT